VNAPRVFVQSYGCQMNKLDAEIALGVLEEAGYARVSDPAFADVVLIFTCSVRAHAEERVYSNAGKLKHLKRRRPDLVIGIMGCMAQREGKAILRRLPHVDFVCGTFDFPRVATLVEQARQRRGIVACGTERLPMPPRRLRTRPSRFQAYVAVMRGCDNFCSYCIVPYVRGREVSRQPAEVLEEVRRLVDDGVREVTLLGQNIDSYGKSFGRPHALADLLYELGKVAGLDRIRFITSHPRDISRPILEAMRDVPAVCEHLHMPAQSGSDRILALMNRGYTASRYREVVALAREVVPGIAIASDFIVGFPGESQEDFAMTAAMVREVRFQNCFVFKYSPRPGTRAAELPDDVPPEEKRRRNLALLAIQEEVSRRSHLEFIGRVVEVLVEGRSRRDPRRLSGRTRSNHIVVFEGETGSEACLVPVRIVSATPLTLVGERVLPGDEAPGGTPQVASR